MAERMKPHKERDLPASEEEWRKRLTPEQFEVLRNKGTERAFTGKYVQYLPGRGDAVEHLRRVHAKYLPEVFAVS